VLVYVAGSIFISVLCFRGGIAPATWNALFWVLTLFTSVTIAGKSFVKETGGQALFSYLYYNPRSFILARIVYNMVFMLALSLVTYLFYSFFIGDAVNNKPLFLLILLLASTGLAGVLSLMSAIAAKAGGNFALMSILSFPVAMPLVLVVIRVSKQAIDGIEWAGVSTSLLVTLAALNVVTVALAWLLFPYLWKD
jgi:heme exporter protein B